jgi:hypothetical protein
MEVEVENHDLDGIVRRGQSCLVGKLVADA